MKLNDLVAVAKKSKKRLGQGHGSGRVKTSGRGTKGQNARSHRSLSFEGGALPLIKRLPFRRGKGKNKVFKKTPVIINLDALNIFKADSVIDLKALISKKLVKEAEVKERGVKILGEGKFKLALTIKLPISKKAAEKVIKAGGLVELNTPEKSEKNNKKASPTLRAAGGQVESKTLVDKKVKAEK